MSTSSWARVGRAAAASATAAAATTSAQPIAHARAPTQAQPRAVPISLPKSADNAPDGWLLAEIDSTCEVMFQPYSEQDITEAIEDVVRPLFAPAPRASLPSTVITEVGELGALAVTPTSEPTSEGAAADWAMEEAERRSRQAKLDAARDNEAHQLDNLLKITTRLLRRPGLQQEVVRCMLEDEEVRNLMLRESSNLDGYLEACGISPHINLLPPVAAAAAADSSSSVPRVVIQELPSDGESDVVAKVAAAVATWLDRTGHALNTAASFLGGWLRDRLEDVGAMLQGAEELPSAARQRMAQEDAAAHAAHASSGDQAQPQQRRASAPRRRSGDNLLGGVMMLAVVVFCVLLARRPLRFRRAAW